MTSNFISKAKITAEMYGLKIIMEYFKVIPFFNVKTTPGIFFIFLKKPQFRGGWCSV